MEFKFPLNTTVTCGDKGCKNYISACRVVGHVNERNIVVACLPHPMLSSVMDLTKPMEFGGAQQYRGEPRYVIFVPVNGKDVGGDVYMVLCPETWLELELEKPPFVHKPLVVTSMR